MTSTREDLDTDTAVLAFAKHSRDAAVRAEADLLLAAVTWAEHHPVESVEDAATWSDRGTDCALPLAGEGAPLVAEFCIAEFAAVIARPTIAGRIKIAHALELKYRLPRHWARVQNGTVEPWRACRIAAATLGLTPEAAAYVDAQVAPVARKVGTLQLDRLVELAIETCMPDLAAENAEKAAEARHVTFFHHQVGSGGTTYLHGELDLADAHDLETAITAEAEALRLAGSTDTLDVRRAIAAGRIARAHLGHPLDNEPDDPDAQPSARRVKPRQVVLYVHLSEAAITGTSAPRQGGLELAQVNNHHRTVTAEQVRTWCANPDTGPRRHLRLPLVHPPRDRLRLRARHRPPRRRHHLFVQHRTGLPTPPPAEDTFTVDLHRHRPRHVPVDQPPRPPVPPQPPRHHRRHPRHRPTRLIARRMSCSSPWKRPTYSSC